VQNSLEVVRNRVPQSMKDDLSADFTAEEVETAMRSMKGTSSPGPDGMPVLFYQTYWHIIGPDVTQMALQILNKGSDPTHINNTYISLIPKISKPILPSDFRPIILCNVSLKIVTKAIANRVKKVLPFVITDHQSAFLTNRLITDNILVAFEAFHKIYKTTNKKKGFVGIKLDMAKAYDRIEWSFLHKTLLTMGFPPNLVNTIMRCVTTVSFSILINGHSSNSFNPQRGLRQGDPLSPYLFIICAEVLSGLLTKGLADGNFQGVMIAPSAPPISHLFFADDSLFFCRSDPKEAMFLMNTLLLYQSISGQKVNLDKSEMVFNPRLREDIKQKFQAQLPIAISTKITKYLGMPTQFGRSKVQDFNFIMDRVIKKLKGWKERNLSFAGRGVLIKAVAQAIPVFVMSCFLLPQDICDRIERAVCQFWWGSGSDSKKIHWVSKEKNP
jgi:hypothetical protein